MIFLIELGVHDGVSASTIYVATDGYTTRPTDSPANQFYMDRLKTVGSIERHLFSGGDGVSGGSTGGPSQVGFGTISAINGTPYGGAETIDGWASLSFRTLTIKSLTDATKPLSSATTRFIGTIDQLVTTRALDEFDINIHDRLSDLDKPILLNTYGGTTTSGGLGTADGDASLAGQAKQKIWGRKNNAPCQAANPFDLIYQVNDGAVSVITVYDGGIALTATSDYASLAALLAASLTAGQYATSLALGLFRLGASPAGAVTADVTEGATVALRSAAQIASRMTAWMQAMYPVTAVALSGASVAALDTKNAAECGVLVTAQETGLAAIMRVLNSIGGWLLPQDTSASLFDVGRFEAPAGTAVAAFDLEECLGGEPERVETGDSGKGVPAWKVIVQYDQLGVVQKGTDLFGAISDARRSYLGQEWRQATPVTNAATLTQYPLATTITLPSCLLSLADANAEATRLLNLHSVRRDCWRMKLPIDDAAPCVFGSAVTLKSATSRMGLTTTGKLFTPLGRVDDFGDTTNPPTVTLDLWG